MYRIIVTMSEVKLDEKNLYVVLDFEATCWSDNDEHEIIEWPMALLDLKNKKIASEFMSFVKPKRSELSDFCKNLTSITQDQVDSAPGFLEVFNSALEWLGKISQKSPEKKIIFLTCGNWDLEKMLPSDLELHKVPPHKAKVFTNWINIKEIFRGKFAEFKKASMPDMLKKLNLPLIGHHHRGIDDTRNLATIVLALVE